MSKIKTPVLDVLADGQWHFMAELVERVCKKCRTNKHNVQNVINTLSGGHHIVKEHVDGRYHGCRYRMKDTSAGFGISPDMADFNRLLSAARGQHANDMVRP